MKIVMQRRFLSPPSKPSPTKGGRLISSPLMGEGQGGGDKHAKNKQILSIISIFILCILSLPALGKNPEPVCESSKSKEYLNKDRQLKQTALLYRDIFEAQKRGDFKVANELVEGLEDCRLMGYVLAQRYLHPTAYRAHFEELRDWMTLYADQGEAKRIFKLAQARRPDGNTNSLREPAGKTLRGALEPSLMISDPEYDPQTDRPAEQSRAVRAVLGDIRKHISNGFPTGAVRAIDNDPAAAFMTPFEKADAYTRIAFSYLLEGKPEKALTLSKNTVIQGKHDVPLAGWTVGLASWLKGDNALAAQAFEMTASSKSANGWLVSAAAFWASRAHLRDGNLDQADYWLKQAASFPRSFYGLIAIEALGQRFDFHWAAPEFGKPMKEKLLSNEAGARAYLLIASGQYPQADSELSLIDAGDDQQLKEALISFALEKELPGFALRFGNAYRNNFDRFYDAALYPTVHSDMMQGAVLDDALLFAFMRQESKFAPRAESQSGALGLMQVLPSTAAYVTKDESLKKDQKWRLREPKTNISVGDAYIRHLMAYDSIDRNLFKLLVAYNAGPGNFTRWEAKLPNDDPLLFIELVPSAETRAFVERVMRNLWIYRLRLGQETPSLKAVASGAWPEYERLDK